MVANGLRDAGQLPFVHRLIHTGQHYDDMLSDVFFRELALEPPYVNLEVGPLSITSQAAQMLERLDDVITSEAPDLVLVYGDTTSTLATALASAIRDVPLIHVEAGERIYRRKRVPEEINRVLTDDIASLCLTCTDTATQNLKWEGFADDRVRFVGDPMFDLFLWGMERVDAVAGVSPGSFGLSASEYHLATIHRHQNTSSPDRLLSLLEALDESRLPVLLPVHPRVRRMLEALDWKPNRSLRFLEPLGYFDFMRLLLDCRRVATDSGGVMREAFFAQKPSIVPMENSWWSEIVEAGWAIEVGENRDALTQGLDSYEPTGPPPIGLFGDGDASRWIIDAVVESVTSDAARDGPWHHHGRFDQLPRILPSNLSLPSFRGMVTKLLDKDYRFLSFPDIGPDPAFDQGVVLLRHDIDIDVSPGVELAELEHEMGVRATYFLMVRNDRYNVLSPRNLEGIRRILELGHFLGLHFDCSIYPSSLSVEQFADATRREVSLLETWVETKVEAVSFHRPDPKVLQGDPGFSHPLPHTYMERFTTRMRYISDSRGTWREGDPTESEDYRQHRSFQILVHPVWWTQRPMSPYHRLERFVRTAQDRLERSIASDSIPYRVGPFAEEPHR